MKMAQIFCLCLEDNYLNKVKDLGYIPVGLGKNNFSSGWLRDNQGKNITEKNPYYGEYSFHYWLWKNELKKIPNDTWIGFCTYRRFWQKDNIIIEKNYDFKSSIINEIPKEWYNYDVILGTKMSFEYIRWLKILKYGKMSLIRNPSALIKKGRNIKFQFDMFHGNGLLDQAINLLDENNKKNFKKFVIKETSFNPFNMFVCRSKSILQEYYITVFDWLNKCEKIFGFDLKGYGKIRLYAFLAERFLPYWFHKNTKVKEWPILFHDLND